MAATEPDVLVVIGERQLTLDASRSAGFLGLFTTATDRASYRAILRGLASALDIDPLDETTPITIGERAIVPPAA